MTSPALFSPRAATRALTTAAQHDRQAFSVTRAKRDYEQNERKERADIIILLAPRVISHTLPSSSHIREDPPPPITFWAQHRRRGRHNASSTLSIGDGADSGSYVHRACVREQRYRGGFCLHHSPLAAALPRDDLPNTYDQPGDDAGEGDTDPPPLETPCVCMAAVATNKGMCMHGKLSNARGQVNSVLFLFTVTSACVGFCLTYRAQEGRKRPPSLCERGSRVGV